MTVTDISQTMKFGTEKNTLKTGQSVKNFYDLKRNINCYFEQNLDELRTAMAKKFDNSTEIEIIETRFFKAFINNMSNIYKGNSSRTTNLTEEQQENFREASIWMERYYNISKESMLYIKNETEFEAFDPSEYLEISKKIVLLQSGDSVVKFEVGAPLMIAENKDVSDFQESYSPDDFSLYQGADFDNSETLKTLPFVFVKPKRIANPYLNPLIGVESEFICAVSWGMYNANPKMLTQVHVETDQSAQKAREALKPFGKSYKILTLGTNDKLGVVDMGDLKNLLDLFASWKIIIEQRALMNGVDKNSVFVQSEMISGEAKKVEMLYINEVRKDNFSMYKKYERDFAKKLTEMFGKLIVIEGIVYEDIALNSEDMSQNLQEQKQDANISDNSDVSVSQNSTTPTPLPNN